MDRDTLEQSDSLLKPTQSTPAYINLTKPGLRLSHVLLFYVLVISLTLNLLHWIEKSKHVLLERLCSSPIHDAVNTRYETVSFNGYFFKETIFRKPAGPEVDAAWESLGTDYLPVLVPKYDKIEKYGLKPGCVKRRKDQGGGYSASVEVTHHLHCLNLLRKVSYYNFEYYSKERKGALVNSPEILQVHTTHCLDILRQHIMCTADTGIFGQIWVRAPVGAFVDFNTKHKCKNFDAIRAWAERNQVGVSISSEMRSGDLVLEDIP